MSGLRKGIPKHCTLTVPMSPELYGQLADLAAASRRSMSNFVRLLIERAWQAETGETATASQPGLAA